VAMHVALLQRSSIFQGLMQSLAYCTDHPGPSVCSSEVARPGRRQGKVLQGLLWHLEDLHVLRNSLAEPINKLITTSLVIRRKEIRHAHIAVSVIVNRPVDFDVCAFSL